MVRIAGLVVCIAVAWGLAQPIRAVAQDGDIVTLNSRIIRLYIEGKYAEAIPLAQRVLSRLDATPTSSNSERVLMLNHLGALYEAQGRFAEAEPFYARALAIREKAQNRDHPDVAESLDSLAALYRAQGRYGEAEPLYIRSLGIREKALGADDPDVAASLNGLAEVYRATGRYAEAEPLYQRSLAIREQGLGIGGPIHTAAVLSNLAGLYQDQGRYAEAEPLYRRSLAIEEKELESRRSVPVLEKQLAPDRGVAKALNNLATLYDAQGRYTDAETLYKRALAMLERGLGPDHPDVAVSLNNLAYLYQAQGRFSEVEGLYIRALAISEKSRGRDHPETAIVVGNFGSFLKSEGRVDEAEPLLARALRVSRNALGAEHPKTISATVQLAELYALQGRTTEAEVLFAKVIDTRPADLKQFPVFFGTNRKRDTDKKRITFGIERNLDVLTLGIVKVLVPSAVRSVSVGRGAARNVPIAEAHVADVRQLAIQSVDTVDADDLVRAARERLLGARTYLGQALVFVHGYNVSFDNAVRRAGQLAYDLGFDGPVFMFSWPSREKLLSYVADRESAQLSAEALRQFLEAVIAETRAKRIHIIAHSMGNVALNEALHSMDPEAMSKLNLGEMVLASPDLDPDLFQRTYMRLQKRGATSTVYAASSDWALWSSSWLRERAQLGYIPPGGPTRFVPGTDLIDITAANSDIFSLNHDLYANSPAIIKDLRRLMKEGQRPPEARTLDFKKLSVEGGAYWRYVVPVSKP